jgi:1,4-dihydroxy-2-naphthoate octaprenyltransferase
MRAWDFIKGLKAPIYFTSISPVLLGWAFSRFQISYIVPFLLVVTISMQAGMNLAMDYFDHANSRPLRNGDTVYPLGSYFIEKLGVKPTAIRVSFVVMLTLAVVSGLMVVYITRNLLLLYLGLTAVFLSLLYVIPPVKLGARGVGEVATFFSFGPFPVLGTIIALHHPLTLVEVLVSMSLGLLASSIRYLHHLPEDKEGGIRVKHFRTIYPIMLITASIMTSVSGEMLVAAVIVFIVSLVHIAYLPRSSLGISRQTNYSVGIHFLFTVLIIASLAFFM